ncbi:corA-like Mg2+ transporter protein [Hirsutella rhossiliensis]|uniref:CorA-like mg2+ transporter protein n=1 Tax=Hirsutella rhossiliensis TaxID=111463 RepID=A0A9P8SNM3_9HYPO|nr:corA-like mg2+ transporter protein [Hirsutella rhossiliensis]KAH0967311.1 corA-like mg2+ transporter protein [Hirsutella rhossiliensis]
MWHNASSYQEPRVRFAGSRSGRQRHDGPYDGAAARPWRSYTDDDFEYRLPLPPPPPPARPVPVRVYGRSGERQQRRQQQQQQQQQQQRPVGYRESVAVYPSRLRMARPFGLEESFGREEVSFAEPPPPAAAPTMRVFDAEQPPPSERRFATTAYDDAQQDEDGQYLFDLPAGPDVSDGDSKPGRGDGVGEFGWSEGSMASSLRPASQAGDDDIDVLDGFDFVFPRAKSSSLSSSSKDRELAELLDSAAGAAETEPSLRDDAARPPSASSATRAFSSTYTGDAELGGVHGATLTVLHDPKGRSRPLYHWLHIQQDVMNFDEFWAEIPCQVRLSEAEMAATAKLRAEVKRHAVKSRQNSKGDHVGYMDPRYFQVPLQDDAAKKKQQQQQQQQLFASWSSPAVAAAAPCGVAAARWICLPYFSLQRCAGLLLASSLASFPPLTLLQSHYSRTPQQRDLGQAVCELGAAPRGDCFHVAQLWCLVLDNTLLVTCGSMAQSSLYGDFLKVVSQPSKAQSSTAEASGRILVSYGGAVTWALDVQDCPTWFSFLSRFGAYWPKSFEFTWHDRVVTPDSWPKILKVASRPQGSVALSLRVIPQPEPPKATLKPEDAPQAAAKDVQDDAAGQAPEYLHVLTLRPADSTPPADPGAASSAAELEALNKQLEAAERFLLGKTSYAQQRAYRSCRGATRADVRAYLADRGDEVEAKASDSMRRAYEERVNIFHAADALFQLFFPRGFDGPTTSQYWASVKSLVLMPPPDNDGDAHSPGDPEVLRDLRLQLRAMSQDIQAFQSIVAYADDKNRAAIDLPRPFVKAWLHVVSSMIKVGASTGQGSWSAHMAKAKAFIEDGVRSVLQGISSRSLVEDLAVLPMEVMSLIAMDLLQDQVGKADDIAETYSQYLSSLDTDITTKPSDRSYQHRVELVQQEMSAIKKTLARQRHILGGIRSNLSAATGSDAVVVYDVGPGHRRSRREATPGWDQPPAYGETAANHYASYQEPVTRRAEYFEAGLDAHAAEKLQAASKLSPTDGLGFRGLFLTECARIVEQREFDFRRHTEFAEDLERAAAYKMGWTKDRQENAIYAFTIVTIIFLPISATSSIFGMNTSDVRNMVSGQWLYWAVTVPVTLMVILIGLWWMNELGNVIQWIMGKRPDRAPGAGNTVRWVSQMPGTTYMASAPPQLDPETAPAVPYAGEVQGDPVSARWRRYSEDLQPVAAAPQLRRRPQTMYVY